MDSFSFHFESMNTLNLQPLRCDVTRLSPAKSTSSIDQFTHHHGKGDSAYSSFSACSSAPDYASPFLPVEPNPHSLPYTDLKYVKAVYNPNILNNKNPKSTDQLFKSVEAISHQCHSHNSSPSVPHRDRELSSQFPPPPTPPARIDSLKATKNMEEYKAKVSPKSQSAEKSHQRTSLRNLEAIHSRNDSACGLRISQLHLGDSVDLDGWGQTLKQSQFPDNLSYSLPSTIPPENQSENQRKRSRSDYVLSSAEKSSVDNQFAKQNVISGNVQHKGQFYFVTGVSSESRFRNSLSSVAEGDSKHRPSEDPHGLMEMKVRSHSCTESVNSSKSRHWSSHEVQGDEGTCSQSVNVHTKRRYEESQRRNSYSPSHISKQEFHSLDSLDENTMSTEMGLVSRRHHSSSHHIFYCGPEDSTLSATHNTKDMTPTIPNTEQGRDDKEEPPTRATRRSLGDAASDKISKETTPLLYHLTEASRGVLVNWPKNSSDSCETQTENIKSNAPVRQLSREEQSSSGSVASISVQQTNLRHPDVLGNSTGTLDDSYKKYYKEKLKDAQSKVLRETSFKRKDLLLSWPHRLKQRPEPPRPVLLSAITQKDLKVPAVCPANSDIGPEAQGKENRNGNKEVEKGKENGKPPNVPEPQVARIGSRKRLGAEQKKLCYSEPEKLHQMGAAPMHVTCSSLGSDKEMLLSHYESSEEGLVASRKKMFEAKSGAFSGVAKNALKQIQLKALVAYMERKVGHKPAEDQQPAPAQRHSTARKAHEWVLRPLSGNVGPRKKLQRPHSAGSATRYSHSGPVYSFQNSHQSSLKEVSHPAKESFASTENLLDLREQTEFQQSYPTSSTKTCEVGFISVKHFSVFSRLISQKKAEGEARVNKTRVASFAADKQVRLVASRGKSMEELGVTHISTKPLLSRSSEQLDQLGPDQEKRSTPFWEEQKQPEPCAHRDPLIKQDSAPELTVGQGLHVAPSGATKMDGLLGRSSHSRARAWSVTSGSTRSSSVLPSIVGNSVFYTGNIHPFFSHNQFLPKEAGKTRSNSSCCPASSSTSKAAPPACLISTEMSVRHQTENQRPDSMKRSLSYGVTDSISWLTQNDELIKNEEEHYFSSGDISTAEVPNPSPVAECVQAPAAQAQAATSPGVTHEMEVQSADNNVPEEEEDKGEEGLPASESGDLEDGAATVKLHWVELVQEVVAQDQSLARVLFPVTNRKTAVMLMEQLLSEDTLLMEEHYRKKHEQQQAEESSVEDDAQGPDRELTPPKSGHMQNKGGDVTEKKRVLVSCIEGRLQAVEGQRTTLHEEVSANALRGGAVDALVRNSCLPAEYERYVSFIGDLERVVSLLLCLSARLARVQNALSAVGDHADAEEKQSLDNRHRLLCKQREDAKELKDNLDRRERVVSAILARHLTAEQLQDYRHFIQTTAALLIRQKDLDERQRLGEEQLESLLNSISP
ncbi:protein Shroom1-like isoform X1 [Arapaima gigas]